MNSNEKEEIKTGDVCQVPSHAEAFEDLDVAFIRFERGWIKSHTVTTEAHQGLCRYEKMWFITFKDWYLIISNQNF